MSRFRFRAGLLVSTLAAVARFAGAQAQPVNACEAQIDQIPNEYVKGTLVLAIDPGYGINPVDSIAALTSLSVVNDALVLPKPLTLPMVVAQTMGPGLGESTPTVRGYQGFMGEAFIELARDGKSKRVGLTQTTLVPAIDAALVAAVQKALDDGAFLPYQEGARGSGGFVFIELRTIPLPTFEQKAEDYKRPESISTSMGLPFATESKLKKRGRSVQLPISYLRIPIIRMTTPLALMKKRPDPAFPRDELYSNQEGFVNVEFVVGPDSIIVPGTLRIANGMTAGFAKAVVNSLKDYHFKPATIGSCPVAARESWTFTFEVR